MATPVGSIPSDLTVVSRACLLAARRPCFGTMTNASGVDARVPGLHG